MAIVRMKHLRLIASDSVHEELLRDMSKLGCVEISASQVQEDASGILKRGESSAGELKTELSQVQGALEILSKYAKHKRGLFPSRHQVTQDELFDKEFLSQTLKLAELICELDRKLSSGFTEEGRLIAQRDALSPWKALDVALDTPSGASHSVVFATIPSVFSFESACDAAKSAAESAELFLSCSDREQHYFLMLCHADDLNAVNDALRPFGFSRVQFKDLSGTATQNIANLDAQISSIACERESLRKEIESHGSKIPDLEKMIDALNILLRRELSKEKLMTTEKTVMLDGWFPEREGEPVKALLDMYQCAYEIRDPLDEEEPPVLTYSSRLTAPFGIITNMYSPPAYRGIDPNPFMAPFFAVFFGIMLSDAAYGLILLLASAVVLLKFKPRGGMQQAMILVAICGVSTTVWGLLFGGFFGDAIASVYKLITGETFTVDLALWFNPLNDPMKMLVFSFILGGIHIFAGMAVQAYMLIRDGHFWDAVFDIGFWWMVLAGLVFLLLGMTVLGGVLAGSGALGLLLTQGRHEKKLMKKITAGLSSLYDITSYLGDILSYSRLLALSLATAVVASVMNTMGVMTGPIGFVIVFLIGHTFNIAINLIGSYVHTARLQYVEFFGKFYQSGGSLFDPLDTQTKYVDIIKEEH